MKKCKIYTGVLTMIKAVSKNKITHFIHPNSKRTLCNINVAKGNWTFYSAKADHPKCECCEKIAKKEGIEC